MTLRDLVLLRRVSHVRDLRILVMDSAGRVLEAGYTSCNALQRHDGTWVPTMEPLGEPVVVVMTESEAVAHRAGGLLG